MLPCSCLLSLDLEQQPPVSQHRGSHSFSWDTRYCFFVLLCCGPLHQWHHRGSAEFAMGSVFWHVLFCIRGVCLWYSYGMAALLQQVVLLRPVDCERPAAVHWLALCGCCDGQLVWESWVCCFLHLTALSRGVVFGLWSACASVGNILGACLASSVLQYGYEYAFLVTASVQFAGGIVIFFGLLVSPEEIGLPSVGAEESSEEDSQRPLINGAENEDDYEPNYSIQEDRAVIQVKAISFHQACCLPGVIPYSLAYACLKLVNYSFFFWLPFYLSNNFGWKEAEADKLSIWYDVGGIIGGTLQGFISDVLQKRAPVLALSLFLAVGSLVGYSRSPNNKSINALLMTITGFFIGGPSNMVSSAISADLGRQELIQGSSEALATVTGIVDGTGSIGAAVGQYLVSLIQDNLGWMWVFYFFILMTSCTILFISPLIVREVFSLVQRRQAHILNE
ncbi:sugar phosphate exchanger 3 isoform X2 [Arvicanthis niloticus]|uniref:sugar phosphate exchanger 3 isoform X2 n=1 Tax=Arvicanthis niloticus TaxID=61156 RepID=UPI00402BC075